METTSPFDLNTEVANWTQTLSQSPAVRADNLDELEAHLRDTVDELEGKGLSTEEAFVLARRRLGPVEPIEAEFAKVNPSGVWLHRVLWMLIGVQAWALINGIAHLVGDAVLVGGLASGGSMFRPTTESAASVVVSGGLYLGTQILVTVLLIALFWLLANFSRRKAEAKGGRSIRALWLTVAILGGTFLILGLHAGQMLLFPLSARIFSVEQMGGFAYTKSLAHMVILLTQTVLMALGTLLVALRLFGAKSARKSTAQ